MKRWGIRKQVLTLALLPAAFIAVILTITFIMSSVSDNNKLFNEKGRILTSQLAVAVEYAVATKNIAILDNLTSAVLKEPDVAQIRIIGASGLTVTQLSERTLVNNTASLIEFRSPIIQSKVIISDFEFESIEKQGPTIGWVIINLSNISTIQRQKQDFIEILLIVVFGLTVAAIFAMRIGGSVINPIFKMSAAVKKIAEGKFTTRIEEISTGELKILEKGINNMAARLQKSHDSMQKNIDEATEELRVTLNDMELMNAELDITSKKSLESSRVKSEFLSNMSHEIRTPMNGIIGIVNILKRTKLNDEQAGYINTVHKSATSLLNIINEILDFSKLESGKQYIEKIDFNLREIIEDAMLLMEPSAEDKNLKIALTFYTDVPDYLIGDPHKIKQVFTNLLSNAIKFTNEGPIIVNIMVVSEDKNDATIRVSIQDKGIGISKENQKSIFSAFTQADASTSRKFGGTGLGLVISKTLIELMGGKLDLQSKPEEGSTFSFEFPCKKQKTPLMEEFPERVCGDSSAKAQNKVNLFNINILVVDDNDINRLVITHLLSKAGANVTEASNGKDAIDLCSTRKFDLIFMDVHMPVMDGETAVRQIRAKEGDIYHVPIIAITADVQPERRDTIIQSGMDDCIYKPYLDNDIWGAINKWLDPEIISFEKPLASPQPSSTLRNEDISEQVKSVDDVIDTRDLDNHPCFKSEFINIEQASQITGGNRKLIAQLFSMFIQELPDIKHKINSHFKNDLLVSLGEVVHKLYGASSYCGAYNIEDSSAKLELALVNKNHRRFQYMVDDLNIHIDALLNEQSVFSARKS